MQISEPNKTFEITFTVDKTEALKAGKTRWGEVKVEIDPAELNDAERSILARGVDKLPWHSGPPGSGRLWTHGAPVKSYAECTDETVRDAIANAGEVMAWYEERERCEREERERANRERIEKRIQDLLADAPRSLLVNRGQSSLYKGPLSDDRPWEMRSFSGEVIDDPRIAPHYEEAKRLLREHNDAWDRKLRADIEASNQKEAAAKERRRAQIDDWVAEHATHNQKKRHAAGLLPEAEVFDGMRDQAFAPLDAFERYQKLTDSYVYGELGIDTLDADHLKVDYDVDEASEATAEEFETLETIRAVFDGRDDVTVTLREHIAECEDHGQVSRKSVRVEIKVGEFTFSREYACPQPTTNDAQADA